MNQTNTAFDMRVADKLAYECILAVIRGDVGERSGIGDAVLDYLKIGHPGGPPDVRAWMSDYEGAYVPRGGET